MTHTVRDPDRPALRVIEMSVATNAWGWTESVGQSAARSIKWITITMVVFTELDLYIWVSMENLTEPEWRH